MSKLTFYEENDQLLKCLLEKRFFEPWQENFNTNFQVDQASVATDANLELYITSSCNQNCEYCYLVKHPGLYPKEIQDHAQILKNLNILFNWCIDNNYAINLIELFSGEIWHTSFGEEVLEVTLKAIARGFKVNQIIIPSNCSFIKNPKSLEKIQGFINDFADVGTSLIFSVSVDGKIIDNYSRPFNDKSEKDDDFYEILFSFARYNHYLFHPMVSAYNVKDWVENFNWWVEMFEEFGGDPEVDIMTLEVRDGDWNQEAIQYYKDFLDCLLNYRLKQVNNNIKEFTRSLFFLESYQKPQFSIFSPKCNISYSPIYFSEAKSYSGCSINTHLTVRAGDLAICPCHRTSYDKYLYGKFVVENDKIVDIKANNIQMATQVILGNVKFNLGCPKCIFKDYCLKGCYGAQVEYYNDPFVPDPAICNFFKEKYTHLLKRYEELGVIDELKKVTPYSYSFLAVQKFLNFYNEVMENYEMG